MDTTLKIIKDFGGLGLAALIIWYFMSTIAPKMQQDQKELLSHLIEKYDNGLGELQKQTITVQKENRELFLAELERQRNDFIKERERGWKVIEKLEMTVEEHFRQAQRVWSTYQFLTEDTIKDITRQLIEHRKLEEQKNAQ